MLSAVQQLLFTTDALLLRCSMPFLTEIPASCTAPPGKGPEAKLFFEGPSEENYMKTPVHSELFGFYNWKQLVLQQSFLSLQTTCWISISTPCF